MWNDVTILLSVSLIQLVYQSVAQPPSRIRIYNGINGQPVIPGIYIRPPNSDPIVSPPTQPSPTSAQNPPRLRIRPPPRYITVAPLRTSRPRFTRPAPYYTVPNQTPDWNSLLSEATRTVNGEDDVMRRRLENDLDRYPHDFSEPDPLLFSESPENAESFSRQSRLINWVARLLKQNHQGYTLRDVLSHTAASRHSITCPFVPPPYCNPSAKYRSVDGTCNNLDNPLWGSAFTPFVRFLPAEYETRGNRDDFSRSTAFNGQSLPNPREISVSFHQPPTPSSDDSIFSMLITQFGQFLAHDGTDRAPTKGYKQSVLKCCKQSIPTPDGVCANFPVPARDEFRAYGRECMEFPRSLEVTDLTCTSGVREQLNQASSFIDGGAIYGVTKNRSDTLRRFSGGLLMMSVPQQLPIIPHGNSQATMQGFAFYAAGDNRVNEFVGLVGMETVWFREHNRIAKRLAELNPFWNDEKLFQETRRIIVSILQHVTYAEYLPAILGPDLMRKYDLQLLARGHYRFYDRTMNPGLSNVFATGAMRFGHSMLRTTYSLLDRQRQSNGYPAIDLKDAFFTPQLFLIHEDPFMRGLAAEPSKICDRVLSQSAINNLYETKEGNGGDLAANNIQRGREHGLPSYTAWRRYYGLSVPTGFHKFSGSFSDHSHDTVQRLSRIYSHVRDVDMFVGGVSETPVKDGAVGPLFGNIIGEQFKKTKKGDRFWYETNEQPQAFTTAQLSEIRNITLARILCNTYSIESIQRRAFYNAHPRSNPLAQCSTIPDINLNAWRER